MAGRDDAPFGPTVELVRAYRHSLTNRLAVDARLGLAGHIGRPGRSFELVPGVSLRFALAVIYGVLSDGKSPEQQHELDVILGLAEGLEDRLEQRTAPDVPTTTADPVAMSLLAAYGETA